MELDRFKTAWSDQPISAEFSGDPVRLVEQVQRQVHELRRRVQLRDLLETGSAVFVAVVFSWGATYGGFLMQAGAAIVIATAAMIVIVLHTVRRRGVLRFDADLKQRLVAETDAVKRQIRLLRNVLYWYVGPLLVGGLLFGLGILTAADPSPGLERATLLALITASQLIVLGVVTAAIRWLRQTVLQRQLEPALAELTRRLASLTDDAPR